MDDKTQDNRPPISSWVFGRDRNMWLKPLLVVALAGIYAQAKEEGNGQNYGKVEEETRWSSKVVGGYNLPTVFILV